MARSRSIWAGKTDDAAAPPRVKDRVAQRANDCCQKCTRPIGGKLRAEFDHVIPLILGGKNQEDNLQLLCHECHAAKTAMDVKIKSKIARSRAKRLGLFAPRQRIKSRGFSPSSPQHSASRKVSKRMFQATTE